MTKTELIQFIEDWQEEIEDHLDKVSGCNPICDILVAERDALDVVLTKVKELEWHTEPCCKVH